MRRTGYGFPVAEYEIYSKFNEIVGDRTAVYIIHRLSSCRFCDEILVFHEGKMIQQGSHEELLAKPEGKYAQLWDAQANIIHEIENPIEKNPVLCIMIWTAQKKDL